MDTHLVTDSIYTKHFIEFLKENFPERAVTSVMSYEASTYVPKNEFVVLNPERDSDFAQLANLLSKSEKIFLHSLFDGRFVFFLFINSEFLKKTKWIIWGGDLYNYWLVNSHSFQEKIHEAVKGRVIAEVSGIVALVKEDYDFAKEKYNTSAEYFYAFYPNPVNYNLLDNIMAVEKTEDGCAKNRALRILVGNSASPTSNHFEALNILAKMKNSLPMQIFCPLSYGDPQYARKVFEVGREVFGDSFVPLTRFMPPEEYFKFLSDIDIAVFAHKRQQALGNILPLLYLGKKVYIRSDISTWKFLNRIGAKVFDYTSLVRGDITEFASFDPQVGKSNHAVVKEQFSKEACARLWKAVFESNCGG